MTRFPCRCPKPNRYPSPFKRHSCVRCMGEIRGDWLSNDANVEAFFDRLAECFPNAQIPDWFEGFRRLCESRERTGREVYDLAYVGRDNPHEAKEKAVDGALYHYLELLNKRHQGHDEDTDLHLIAAMRFAEAYYFSALAQAKRRGNTGPPLDER